MTDLRLIYDLKERDPRDYPLFEQVWNILTMAPSSKHADEEELISLAWDAFDYLQASGRWATASTTGRTEMSWDGSLLNVKEDNDRNFFYENTFTFE